ncbi:hypothetical protein WH91_10680 [Devosia psychrophila]|uniref:Uncharacterized protein n=1 Tax=Devosia psychrophila TaxID=728005 RepID=A0ABR5DYX8_9HYPH|nr:hypothetical protein WH91_10680 [Devosia psychrophila]
MEAVSRLSRRPTAATAIEVGRMIQRVSSVNGTLGTNNDGKALGSSPRSLTIGAIAQNSQHEIFLEVFGYVAKFVDPGAVRAVECPHSVG